MPLSARPTECAAVRKPRSAACWASCWTRTAAPTPKVLAAVHRSPSGLLAATDVPSSFESGVAHRCQGDDRVDAEHLRHPGAVESSGARPDSLGADLLPEVMPVRAP